MPSALQGQHRQLFGKFKFLVDINGFTSAAFQSASGLKYNVAKIEYYEGASLIAFKEPGRVTFDDLALERGVSYDLDFYNWLKDVVDLIKYAGIPKSLGRGGGTLSPKFKRQLICKQLERDNETVVEYEVTNAFPTELSSGDFDNNSDEVTIEMTTLTYDYYTRTNIKSILP